MRYQYKAIADWSNQGRCPINDAHVTVKLHEDDALQGDTDRKLQEIRRKVVV